MKGFTLIELMIVVAIIGIITTIGFNTFQSYSSQQSILTVVRSMQSDLRFTEESAISGNKAGCNGVFLGYSFATTANSYTITANCSGGNISVKTVNLQPNGITLSPITTIVFKALGQGTNLSGNKNLTLTQTSTNNSKTITIDPDGTIQ